jgi:serine/threonine protein kinase
MEPLRTGDPVQLGDWRIMGRLGEGGFGTVFLAERGAQKAAIKVLRLEYVDDENARLTLAQEADVLKKLTDPSIGKIMDSDLQGTTCWIATEFINGPTLEVKVKYEGPLEEAEWFRLASNILHALESAHELGITHKDVKPSNIILGETGTKLIDFGIAHVSGSTRTMHYGDREGSTPYSSPEHFLPRSNPKMDVFSAAVTLAYAGKGESIWAGKTELQLMQNINYDEPDLTGLTKNQQEFLKPLLAKNHSERMSACEALDSANEYIEKLIPILESALELGSTRTSRIRRLNLVSLKSIALFFVSLTLIASFFGYNKLSNSAEPTKIINGNTENNLITASPSPSTSSGVSTTPAVSESPSTAPIDKSSGGTNSSSSVLAKCKNLVTNSQFTAAITSCLDAAKDGKSDSLYNLGLAYNGSKDLSNARAAFEKCSKMDDYRCTSELAYFFSREGKTSEARRMWISAYNKGWSNAAVALGVSYNLENDFNSAISWWKKAVDLGETDAEIYISDAYKDDLKDYPNALLWAKRMLKDKVPTADQRIGHIYSLQGKTEEAKQYLTTCGNAGNVSCMSILSLIFYDEKDSPKAVIWAKRAASQGFVPSYNLLTRIYMWLDYDLAQAKIWAQKSASTGDFEGIFSMGALLTLVDNDVKASCLQYAQIIAKAGAMIKNNTDSPSTADWMSKATEQYQKRDCKNLLS